jgi:sucrose-6-phosphate hydrolase SacC (GH32 family)
VYRASIEIFVNEGEVSASVCYLPDAHQYSLVFYAHGGEQTLDFELHELDSIWQQNG